jgi:arsenical pump membrane protein
MMQPAHWATWTIAALTIGGIVLRPWRLPEAGWAVLGAAALLAFALITPSAALAAVREGTDVYLFLIGMMLLSELAREEGLFDWLAAYAVMMSKGSPARLFALVYLVGIVVTVFLSNDATAVVLTPAVCASARQARTPALPYVLICAFIANAASFVLPISNPANLVVYGSRMPPLADWMAGFGLASIASIAVTFIVLERTQRKALAGRIEIPAALPSLSAAGKIAAAGIAATAAVLLSASALGLALGLATFLAALVAGACILLVRKGSPLPVLRAISWSIVPMVAGLFVIAQAIENTGLLAPLAARIPLYAAASPHTAALAVGGITAAVSNLVNNLPLGLIAGSMAHGAHLAPGMVGALLVGVDLGPNLSVTGSLATILWLVALRREGEHVTAGRFLAVGVLVMPPALLAALLCIAWLSFP